LKVPVTVGVPEIVPPEEMDRPLGRPVAVKVYGPPDPPLATSVTGVIAMPLIALIYTQVALTEATMVMGQVPEATMPFASLTWMLKEPGAVGVPVTAPVEVFSVRPAGSVPTIEKV
jgi:hypothetical protein